MFYLGINRCPSKTKQCLKPGPGKAAEVKREQRGEVPRCPML